MFFQQRSDRDMQSQLGLRAQADSDRTLGAVVGVGVFGAVASAALLNDAPGQHDELRTALGYVAALLPFAAITAIVVVPDVVKAVLVRSWSLDPTYRKRYLYHEAGHFLIGYLLGLDVDGYDAATGAGAGSAVSFSARTDPRDPAVLDALAVVSMGGVAGEVIACGDAEGGTTDVTQLRALMASASPPLTSRNAQDERIRWATLMALTMLTRQQASLDALADALERRCDVGECVTAIEAAAAAGAGPPPTRGDE